MDVVERAKRALEDPKPEAPAEVVPALIEEIESLRDRIDTYEWSVAS